MLKFFTKHKFYNFIWYYAVISILYAIIGPVFYDFFCIIYCNFPKRLSTHFYGKYGICDPVIVSMFFQKMGHRQF